MGIELIRQGTSIAENEFLNSTLRKMNFSSLAESMIVIKGEPLEKICVGVRTDLILKGGTT